MNKVSSNIEQHWVCTRQDKELEGQAESQQEPNNWNVKAKGEYTRETEKRVVVCIKQSNQIERKKGGWEDNRGWKKDESEWSTKINSNAKIKTAWKEV